MQKYQAYAEYKDSGVEWLGDVPEHWKIAGFKKYLGSIVDYRGKTPEKMDSGIFLVTARNIKNGIIDYSLSQEYVALKDYAQIMFRGKPKVGDVLFTTEAPLGEVAQVDDDNIALAQRVIKFRGQNNILENTFLKYFIMSTQFQDSLKTFATGSTALGIKAERLIYLKQCIPAYSEQTQIANFLDYETAKIDTLIAKQKKLIDLLKEKRQAVISHAVTKGLDPNVRMKASGVEWLGDVPEHWGIIPLKHIVTTWKGVAFKAIDFCDDGIKVIKASDIKNKTIRDSAIYLPNNYLNIYSKYLLKTGDLILSTVGSTPDVKNSAVGQIGRVPAFLNGSFLNQNTVVFNAKAILDKNYLFFLVQNNRYRDHLDLNSHGTANQASLNVADMLDFNIAIPSISEQGTIAIVLDNQTQKIDNLISKAETAIKLMQERRTALISSAVTGKIDVRDWQKPQEA